MGTIEPRKNIDTLLDAYQSVCPPVRQEHDLVIAGPLGWCAAATAERLRTEGHGVRYLGYVAENDLPGLTAAATMFVFPSLYEGFGLPLAQAMACGVPSITSRNSSLGEVAGRRRPPRRANRQRGDRVGYRIACALAVAQGGLGAAGAFACGHFPLGAQRRAVSRLLSSSGVGLNSADEFLASFSQRVLLHVVLCRS